MDRSIRKNLSISVQLAPYLAQSTSRQDKSNLYLVGMMGTGKVPIGKIVSAKLSMDFIDSDQSIEAMHGQSVSEIFSEKGESF